MTLLSIFSYTTLRLASASVIKYHLRFIIKTKICDSSIIKQHIGLVKKREQLRSKLIGKALVIRFLFKSFAIYELRVIRNAGHRRSYPLFVVLQLPIGLENLFIFTTIFKSRVGSTLTLQKSFFCLLLFLYVYSAFVGFSFCFISFLQFYSLFVFPSF